MHSNFKTYDFYDQKIRRPRPYRGSAAGRRGSRRLFFFFFRRKNIEETTVDRDGSSRDAHSPLREASYWELKGQLVREWTDRAIRPGHVITNFFLITVHRFSSNSSIIQWITLIYCLRPSWKNGINTIHLHLSNRKIVPHSVHILYMHIQYYKLFNIIIRNIS